MKKFLSIFFLLFVFCITLIKPCYAIDASILAVNIPTLNYLTQAREEITLIQGDEDFYVVSPSKKNSEMMKSNKNHNTDVIFGEDAFTEDNILKHFVFSKEKLEQNKKYNKLSPTLKNSIYTRAP